jgi:hypothetical protein
MRVALGRRNINDPDSTDNVLLSYLNDFIQFTMTDDVKVFEQFGTLKFTIDQTVTSGVYTFNDVGATSDFSNISNEAFITLSVPVDASVSWNRLAVYYDPGQFFGRWGINNDTILIKGYPTEVLFYGKEFTFRTIPNTSYDVYMYGYKLIPAFSTTGDPELPFDYWIRYLAYGAAQNYSTDYRFSQEAVASIEKGFTRERRLLLTRVHNQRKMGRCQPRF